MIDKILADLVLILHLCFILFVIFGALTIFIRRWFIWIHIPMLCWAILVNAMAWPCPLTPLENHFRILAGQQGYQGEFIEHYLDQLIYPQLQIQHLGITLAILTLVWNLLIYAFILIKSRRK